MQVDGEIFVEHDAGGNGSESSPKFVPELEVSDEEIVEGLNDSEDERTTAIVMDLMVLMSLYHLMRVQP